MEAHRSGGRGQDGKADESTSENTERVAGINVYKLEK